MDNKEKIFIYGTLANSEIQKEICGRIIKGTPDSLRGYKRSQIEIEGEIYPLIVSDANARVDGLVIEVTEEELEKIDEYETNAYKREKINLESGTSAWVYVKA